MSSPQALAIEWLDRATFWQRYDRELRPTGVGLDLELGVALTEDALRASISAEPEIAVAGEGDPGDVLIWYAAVGPVLLILKHYQHPDDPRITLINVSPVSGGEPWHVLKALLNARPLVTSLTSFENEPQNPVAAVTTTNDVGIPVEVYRSGSLDDANALRDWLHAQGARFEYQVEPPEARGKTWLIIRDPQNAAVVGEYSTRLGCEMVARAMSLHDIEVFFCVQSKEDEEVVAMYFEGKRNEL